MTHSKNIVINAPYKEAKLYWISLIIILISSFLINFLVSIFFDTKTIMSNNFIEMFASSIIGILLTKFSSKAIISYIGYLMVIIPVGIGIAAYAPEYSYLMIIKSVYLTTILILFMIFIGFFLSNFFISINEILFVTFISLIIAKFIIINRETTFVIKDWIIATISLGFIASTYITALEEDKAKINNAISRAIIFYYSIIILFFHLPKLWENMDN